LRGSEELLSCHLCGDDGSGGSFRTAEAVTAVSRTSVSVITDLLIRIQRTVSAGCQRTVHTAGSIGAVGVSCSFVTFFTGICLSVSAEDGDIVTVHTATERETRRMEGRLTLFTEEFLNDAVSAETCFQFTLSGTSIEVTTVSVITLFVVSDDTVSADIETCHTGDLSATTGAATVSGDVVPVITLFTDGDDTVSAVTTGACAVSFKETGIAAAVSRITVVVITLFTELKTSVAATGSEAVFKLAVA